MRPVNGVAYLCFSHGTPEGEAVRVFQQRYGSLPVDVFEWNQIVWVGPVQASGE